MNFRRRSDKEMQDLAGPDLTQYDLVMQICDLAYKINHASFADVTVSQAPTTIHVKAVRHFQNTPAIDKVLSIGGPTTAGVTNAMLLCRLRRAVEELQAVLSEGDAPKGSAA